MSNLYLDLLQLSLLAFSLTLLAIVVKNFLDGIRGIHLVVFCFGAVVSGAFFNAVLLKNSAIISLIYPFAVPVFYAMGPALLLHSKQYIAELRRIDLWHYAPAALLLIDLVAYGVCFPQMYEKNLIYAMEGNFAKMNHSFVFSGTFMFTAYVVPTSLYALYSGLILVKKGNWKDTSDLLTLLLSVVVLTPFLQDVVSHYIWGDRLLRFISLDQSRILLVLSAPALVYHVLRYLNSNTAVRALIPNKGRKNVAIEWTAEEISKVQDCVDREYADTASMLLSPGISKEIYVDQTELIREDWERYFQAEERSFSELKKSVRIHHAKRLILDGYLESYSVEGLTLEVGYRSRASFYKAFEKETGMKLSEFRKKIKG